MNNNLDLFGDQLRRKRQSYYCLTKRDCGLERIALVLKTMISERVNEEEYSSDSKMYRKILTRIMSRISDS